MEFPLDSDDARSVLETSRLKIIIRILEKLISLEPIFEVSVKTISFHNLTR